MAGDCCRWVSLKHETMLTNVTFTNRLFRYMLVGIQVVGIPSIVIAYAVDCYKTLPGEIMIAATIVKNTFGVSNIFCYQSLGASTN